MAYEVLWQRTEANGERPLRKKRFDTRFEALAFMDSLFFEFGEESIQVVLTRTR